MLRYILVEPAPQILDDLNRVTTNGTVVSLFGEQGTGKTALLQYWKQHHRFSSGNAMIERRPVLTIDLWRTQRIAFAKGVYVSPVTNVLFNELLYQLGQLSWPQARAIQQSKWYQPTGTLSSDSAFLALFNVVRTWYRAAQAEAVLIDNAQFLDAAAMDMLYRLRAEQRLPTALVFCYTLEKNESWSDGRQRLLRMLPHLQQSTVPYMHPHVLPQLSNVTFIQTILRAIVQQLSIRAETTSAEDRAAKQAFGRYCWEQTQGNWWSLMQIVQRLQETTDHTDSWITRLQRLQHPMDAAPTSKAIHENQ